MKFNNILSGIIEAHGIKAADIHRLTGLKRPYISKLLNGDLVPSSFEQAEKIVSCFGLSLEEELALIDAFIECRSSDENKLSWNALKNIYRLEYSVSAEEAPPQAPESENGSLVTGERLIDELIAVFAASDNIELFFSGISAEGVDRLCRPFSALPDSSSLSWLMPMSGKKESDALGLFAFTNSLKLMGIKDCTVTKAETDLNALVRGVPFPFYALAGTTLILFDADVEKGQVFNDPEIIELYRKRFEDHFKEHDPMAFSFEKAEDVLTYCSRYLPLLLGKKNICYIVANEPCIVFDLSKNAIEDHTIEAGSGHSFADMYTQYLRSFIRSTEAFYDICSVGGITDFLDSEEWYELGKHFSKNILKELRIKALEAAAASVNDTSPMRSLGLRIPDFNRYSFIGTDIMNGGCLILVYDFEEKPLVVIANDRALTTPLISLLTELKKIGLIDGEEKTRAFIQTEIEKRKGTEEE